MENGEWRMENGFVGEHVMNVDRNTQEMNMERNA